MKAPKGTRDLAGQEAQLFTHLETVAHRVFSQYLFSEIRTPLFESVELFSRSLGATSDVVEKEMFTFTDRGDREFALRPEGTAGVVRYFIENKLYVKGGIHRLYYMGPMFRGERPQAGRYRQFWQIGSEHFGDSSPTADADTVLMISKILSDFGASDFTVHVNSLGCSDCRKKYRTVLLDFLKTKKKELSKESLRRMDANPLRVLDSKEDGPKLTNAPQMKEFLCSGCLEHFKKFLSFVGAGSIKVQENPKLVRGLDYYTRTVFEFVSPRLGAQNALAAGGRYDELVKQLGGPSTPAVGFALGMDRLVSVVDPKKKDFLNTNGPRIYIGPLVDEAMDEAYALAQTLRQGGLSVPPIVLKKKIKNTLSQAVDIGARWAILIGEDELAQKQATIKDLTTRQQVKVSFEKVLDHLKS